MELGVQLVTLRCLDGSNGLNLVQSWVVLGHVGHFSANLRLTNGTTPERLVCGRAIKALGARGCKYLLLRCYGVIDALKKCLAVPLRVRLLLGLNDCDPLKLLLLIACETSIGGPDCHRVSLIRALSLQAFLPVCGAGRSSFLVRKTWVVLP